MEHIKYCNCVNNVFFFSFFFAAPVALLGATFFAAEGERKWDLLEGPKGWYGWGHHPYTLLTTVFT